MIPFSPPFIDKDVISEVNDSLTSGWITTGPKVKQLEKEIKILTDCDQALCVNSATSGLMIALKWFGVGKGDEVIVPAYTYSATALAVYHLGAKPVLVDIENDFTIDPEKVRKAINRRTKAIIPVDIAGWPADYDEINKIVKDPTIIRKFDPKTNEQQVLGRILVLSDAAHSLGAFYKGKPITKNADITVYSFHAVKNVTTAEGGAICLNLPKIFNSENVYDVLRLMSLNGQTKDAFTKSKAGGWKYDIVLPGYKMNMPDVCAAIGLAQIRKYKSQLLEERRRVAEVYQSIFRKLKWVELPNLNEGKTQTSYHIYPLRIRNIDESQRDSIIERITQYKVAVNVHFIPLPMLTLFKSMGYDIKKFPVAYDCYSREISLPIYPQLTQDQILTITNAVIDSYHEIIGE